jgi:hypothetical protein
MHVDSEVKKGEQEAFDVMLAHLRGQGCRSVAPATDFSGKTCRYRTSGGLRCAVGALIDDEFYLSRMEGKGAHNAVVYGAVLDSGYSVSERFLAAAQSTLHDMRPDDLADLEETAERFANAFDLVYTAPTNSGEE